MQFPIHSCLLRSFHSVHPGMSGFQSPGWICPLLRSRSSHSQPAGLLRLLCSKLFGGKTKIKSNEVKVFHERNDYNFGGRELLFFFSSVFPFLACIHEKCENPVSLAFACSWQLYSCQPGVKNDFPTQPVLLYIQLNSSRQAKRERKKGMDARSNDILSSYQSISAGWRLTIHSSSPLFFYLL